jgi:hypothetical protein
VGRNQLRIVQTGIAKNATWYDDLGILGIAVEVGARLDRGDAGELPKEPVAAPNP